jgi:hypothetical protein
VIGIIKDPVDVSDESIPPSDSVEMVKSNRQNSAKEEYPFIKSGLKSGVPHLF